MKSRGRPPQKIEPGKTEPATFVHVHRGQAESTAVPASCHRSPPQVFLPPLWGPLTSSGLNGPRTTPAPPQTFPLTRMKTTAWEDLDGLWSGLTPTDSHSGILG